MIAALPRFSSSRRGTIPRAVLGLAIPWVCSGQLRDGRLFLLFASVVASLSIGLLGFIFLLCHPDQSANVFCRRGVQGTRQPYKDYRPLGCRLLFYTLLSQGHSFDRAAMLASVWASAPEVPLNYLQQNRTGGHFLIFSKQKILSFRGRFLSQEFTFTLCTFA